MFTTHTKATTNMLFSAKVMRSSLCRCVRRTSSLLGVGALAAGLCTLVPATAGAHRMPYPQSGVSTAGPLQESAAGSLGESAAGPLQEPAAGAVSESSPEPSSTAAGEMPSRARHSRRNAGAETGCSVTLEATPSRTAPASPLSLSGTLSCPEGASEAGQAVALYQKVARTPGFNSVATTSTEAGGAFQFAVPAPEVNSVFYVRSGSAKSARAHVEITGPEVVIDAPTNGTQLPLGAWRAADGDGADSRVVTITGTVSPADPGATATLQREYRPGKWHRIGDATVSAEGGFSIAHTFHRRGAKTLRVVVGFNRLHVKSISAPVTYQFARQHREG